MARKSKIQNPKEVRSPKSETAGALFQKGCELISEFGFRISALVLLIALEITLPSASGAPLKVLRGHVPAAVARLNPLSRLAATNELRLAIGVPLHDPAGLEVFLTQLYNPASTNYHRYLTPHEFADRFGPAQSDYEAVKQFARTNGLQVAGTHVNRLVLDVTGPAFAVEKALHVTLRSYPHPDEPRKFFAPDAEPSVAADLPVADVQGLSDFYRPHPRLKKLPAATPVPKSGSAPDGGGAYFGDDFRNAYAPGTALTGVGQMVGLLQFDGFYSNDIAAYATAAGGGRVGIPIQTVLLDGYNGVPTTGADSGNVEVSLDIEMAMAMAPGLAKIVVFEAGPSGLPNDVLNSMVTFSNSVKQLSCSWGWAGGPSTTTDNIFKNMAAGGQSFFNASGDSDAFTTGATSGSGVDNPSLKFAPSSSPYITQVGGTTLAMNGNGSSYSSETVWNWGVTYGSAYDGIGSSGGISSYYSMPDWQTNVSGMPGRGGSATARNIPDVALTADDVYVVWGGSAAGSSRGGTSCAAPLWAGFMALVNQQAVASGRAGAGFINPAIYAISAGTNYAACFHDITTGNNSWAGSSNLFSAVAGYDLCTGLGTPNVGLIDALAGPADALGVLPAAGYAFGGPFGGPFAPVSGAFQLTNSSSAALNWSLVNTSLWCAADSTGGSLAAHATTSFNVSLASAASNLGPGNYSASLLLSNQTSQAVQRFPLTLQVFQPLSVSPVKGFAAVGPVGGPFVSGAQTLVLTNVGANPVSWGIVAALAWLSVSPNQGLLAAGSSASVTVSVSSSANSLAAAVYQANLAFTNSQGVFAAVPYTVSIGQPILRNGGFETGDFTNWTESGNIGSSQVASGSSKFVHAGTWGAELGPPYSPGCLTQNLTTSPGQTYLVSLWLRNATGGTPNQFQVQWDGATIFFRTNLPGPAWTNLQFLVTASGTITPLQFTFQNDPDYFGLDDVTAVPVAVPAFKSMVRSANDFQLAWNTSTGLVYQVQYKTNLLLQTSWVNLGGAFTAKTNKLTLTDTNAFQSSLQRFYRLLVLP